jgi:hypothetical protein
VKSRDATGNLATSQDYNFTTKSSLVGLWHFDEGTGSIATDSSGNDNNGTIYGAAWTTGRLGSALLFDGNDYVTIPDAPSLNPSDEITIEAWVKPLDVNQPGWNKIVAKPYTQYSSPWQQYALTLYNGHFVFELNAGGSKSVVYSTAPLTNNTWYHVAATYNGSEMRIYVNGELNGTQSKTGSIAVYPTDLHIGAGIYSDKNIEYIKGVIDEVKIVGTALSADEIKNDYEEGNVSTLPSITAYSPANTTPVQYVNTSYTFTVSTNQPVNSTWYLDGVRVASGTQNFTHTWTSVGGYNVTYVGSNVNGSVSLSWLVVVVDGSGAVEFTYDLGAGWNPVSLPLVNSSLDAANFSRLSSEIVYVVNYSSGEIYPDGGNFALVPGLGYLVYMNGADSVVVSGVPVSGVVSVELRRGFNLVGWASFENSTVTSAFVSPLEGRVSLVSERLSGGGFRTYVVEFEGPEDFEVTAGRAYYVYVNESCTLSYDVG